jgi:hypothetical protein
MQHADAQDAGLVVEEGEVSDLFYFYTVDELLG